MTAEPDVKTIAAGLHDPNSDPTSSSQSDSDPHLNQQPHDHKRAERLIRSWAESKTDSEMQHHGLPAEKRRERIDELIGQRRGEVRNARKSKEEELLLLR